MGATRVLDTAATLMLWAALALGAPPAASANAAAPPQWAVDPAQPGPDAPPIGRSLFDFVFAGNGRVELPFPFDAAIRQLEARAGCTGCARAVLIPLGRSLQRTAAAPDFFAFPRVVVAIDGAPAGTGLLLKDRIFLGYQEKAGVIEIISYNEAAGRFEFQIVTDYRRGGTPRISYARRALCAACHQNLAPIFSRPLWEETNANPRVAALLARGRADFYGIRIRRGVDVPNAIDDAKGRANQIAVVQRLWRDGCGGGEAGARCRAAWFAAALQYRLSDARGFGEHDPRWRDEFVATFTHNWQARWPGGLALPNGDLPNRNPFPEAARPPAGAALTHVAAPFEPLAPRPPQEIVYADAGFRAQLVAALAEFIAPADARALERALRAQAKVPARTFSARSVTSRTAGSRTVSLRTFSAACTLSVAATSARFDCTPGSNDASPARLAGHIELKRTLRGEITSLAVGEQAGEQPAEQAALQNLATRGAFDAAAGRMRLALGGEGHRARLPDGNAIESIELRWPPAQLRRSSGSRSVAARVHIEVAEDFALVRNAIDALASDDAEAFGAVTFSRARVLSALFARLGSPYRIACCEDAARLAPARIEPPALKAPQIGQGRAFAALYPVCATCHATENRFPPNFLAGASDEVAARIAHCAPRIYTRLAMWRIAPAARDKTPMPPPFPTVVPAESRVVEGLAELEAAIEPLLVAEFGGKPALERLLAGGYEGLRSCLPSEEPAKKGAP